MRRRDPGQRSAVVPPATDISPTPPGVPTAVDRPSHVATDTPAADPRRQPHRPAKRTFPPSPAPRTAPAAHPEPAATPKPPQHPALERCCDDRLTTPPTQGHFLGEESVRESG